MKIAPSILSADLLNLENDIKRLENAGADLIHVDIMDGHFVSNITFGMGIINSLKKDTNIPLDVHLMIESPEKYAEIAAKFGADMVLIHAESTPHIYGAVQTIKNNGAKAGVVINPGTSVDSILPVLPIVDQVLIMTVNPGFGGQKFIPGMITKMKHLDQLRQTEESFDFDIEVDGGIDNETIKLCKEAGVDKFVAGSYIFGGDISERMEALRKA